MPRTPAQNKATYKYNASHLKRVPLDLQLSDYDELKNVANSLGESVNGFIKAAIRERIARISQGGGLHPVGKPTSPSPHEVDPESTRKE